MIFTLLYVLLAAFGLGLLIFIHEYGHYWMARKEGMTVEAFSIGFGKPLYTWNRNGVKWQLCCLPFGGFVKIAGMEKEGGLEPYQIANGFYGKRPLSRIKVALMGPCVNIVFAFVIFGALWVCGGRSKPFSDYTHLIGYVDADSGIYASGVRPGDEIKKINHHPFLNFQDFLYAAILKDTPPVIEGEKIDYLQQRKTPFEYRFEYPVKASIPERIQSVLGAIRPASYLIYSQASSFSLDKDPPIKNSGIEDGDRLLWVDGNLVFSKEQLIATINEKKALLTIRRGDQTFLSKVPRLKISDLRLTAQQKAELEDWQHEANLSGRVQDLFFIPYNLTNTALVEGELAYLNDKTLEERPTASSRAFLDQPLQPGDQVIAVDGMVLSSSYEMIRLLQTRHIQIIVQKHPKTQSVSWKEADAAFNAGISWQNVAQIVHSIGTSEEIHSKGNLQLLKPIEPKPLKDLPISEKTRQELEQAVEAQQKRIEEIKNVEQRKQALQLLEQQQNHLILGIASYDLQVNYNPSPVVLFVQVFQETWKTLVALFTGTISPKYMTGPVGIVQVMQHSWSVGFTEALFWLGMISLNLGVLNLLPLPVLDGGHICFSLWEAVTGKPIKSKTMQRFILPFIVLLIALFIYLTYHDIMRLFFGIFR